MDGATRAAVLSLGDQIAATLDEHDLLSRWMAHHLAERLTTVESLRGRARTAAEAEVAELIVRIWEHRHVVQFREDPLALINSVERAVARLDPSANGPFGYYRPFDDEPGPSPAEMEANTALRIALGIDDAAGDIVRSLVRYAAMIAVHQDAAWVRAALDADTITLRDLSKLLGDLDDPQADQDPAEAERSRIAERAKSLSKALRMISSLETEQPSTRPTSNSRRTRQRATDGSVHGGSTVA
jgi:hypothetical protein